MKRVFVGLAVVLLAAVSSMAQQASLNSIKEQRDQQIDAITASVRDIDARYWAREIKEHRTSYGTLEVNSKQWLGSEAAKKELLGLIKQYVNSPTPIVITPKEMKQLDESKSQVRVFLNSAQNPASAALAQRNRQIREIEEPVFELEARYWAYRVANVKDITFDELKEYSYGWVGEYQYNDKLMDKVKENLDTGNTAKLSRSEEKKLEKAKKRVIKLLTPKK